MDATRTTGWRALPPAITLAFVGPLVWAVIRMVLLSGTRPQDDLAGYMRLSLIGEGFVVASQVLLLAGLLEQRRRVAGRTASGIQVAIVGVVLLIAIDVITGLVQFSSKAWEYRSLWKALDYLQPMVWLVVPFGFTLSLPAERRVTGIVITVVAFVLWPLPPLREALWGWTRKAGSTGLTVDAVLRLVRSAIVLYLAILAAQGTTTPHVQAAAAGFRQASKALWLRVIAAVFLVFVTLMMVGARGSGSLELIKLAMMAQGVIGVVALVMFGVGALRAAGAGVRELGAWPLVAGAGASLWCAGVTFAQLPYLYRMLYGEGYSRGDSQAQAQALATALPIVALIGVGLLATALSGYAARRGDDDLRTTAQGHGIGYVALILVAVALQTWMLPKARSADSFAMLSLLAAGASLAATVMMARLF